jgi:hypothetical protein
MSDESTLASSADTGNSNQQQQQACPSCREPIAIGALRCKHCRADVESSRRLLPQHGGTCPFCREQIDPEARICKHCGSGVIGIEEMPNHGGTCPFCKEAIDSQATRCPKCRSTLADSGEIRLVAMMNDTDDRWGHQQCVNRVYDACVARGGRSRVACNAIAERICTNAGQFMGGGSIGRGLAANLPSTEQQGATGCAGCGGCGGGSRQGDSGTAETSTQQMNLQPDGTVKQVTRCHTEYWTSCTAQGCRSVPVRVCITTPEFAGLSNVWAIA